VPENRACSTGHMADWDPFADPSDSAAPADGAGGAAAAVAASGGDASGGMWQEFEQDDIFAALRVSPKEPRQWTAEEFNALLDDLFAIQNDSDMAALKAAVKPIVDAVSDNGALMVLLWRRALPIMMDLVDNKRAGAKRPNLFGLLVDHQMGLMTDADSAKMSEIAVDGPPDGTQADGMAVFLYGWGGANVGDLLDIAGLYRELFPGAVICRMQSCRKASFGLRVQCAYAIKAALMAWAAASTGTKPKLLVHIFSNAGFFTHTEMLQSWKALSEKAEPDPLLGQALPPMESVLRGVIYDSSPDCDLGIGPCLQSNVQAFAAFIYGVAAADHDGTEQGQKSAEWEARKVVQVLIGDASPFKAHLSKKPEKQMTKMSCDDGNTANRLEPAVNMLFIYSLDDTIIKYQGVEKYIDRVKARDRMKLMALPRRVCFEKSKHCFHKTIHREEYWRSVRQFSLGVTSS